MNLSESDVEKVFTSVTSLLRRMRLRGKKYQRRKKYQARKWIEWKPEYQQQQRKYTSMKPIGAHQERKYDGEQSLVDESEQKAVGPEFFLSGASLNDHYITKIVNRRTAENLSTHSIRETLVCTSYQWIEHVRESYVDRQVVEFGESAGMIIDNEELAFIDYSVNSTSIDIRIYGSKEYIDNEHEQLKSKFTVAPCYIEWVYSNDGSSVNIPLLSEKLPITEMYPFLDGETIEEYYDRYLKSSASILLLIGPPGTGKTTFIRGLLHHSSQNAMVTYDEGILQKDYVFARFLEDEVNVMVIEDADNFLKPRSDGNSMMHRFLNVGDGLISIQGKKLIFSTNLPSIKDIDSALTRPGRCFDIINFENYTSTQATALAKKMGVSFKAETNKNYSLAEIFHKQKNARPQQVRRMGFV